MSKVYVIAGTDTDVGKTVFAAALAAAIGARYWKPIQAGLDSGGDSAEVRRLTGLTSDRIVPEAYRLSTAASPHRAAELDGVEINFERLASEMKRHTGTGSPLVIEGAGGLMVPLSRSTLQLDIFARWGHPVILCARTALGTINHSLLSLDALRGRRIPVHGIAFIGEPNEDSERTICDFAGARRLGRLPHIDRLSQQSLQAAFAAGFRIEDFA